MLHVYDVFQCHSGVRGMDSDGTTGTVIQAYHGRIVILFCCSPCTQAGQYDSYH